MNEPKVRTPARLADHEGELVREDDRTLVWLGEMSPTVLAGLMCDGARGALRVCPDGGDAQAVWLQGCWFDVEHGRMVVHLLERGLPA